MIETFIQLLPQFILILFSFQLSPVPSIIWRRVDDIPFSRKVDMRKASGILEIPYFEQDDAGTYECVAENSKGRNSVQGKLSFYGRSTQVLFMTYEVKV